MFLIEAFDAPPRDRSKSCISGVKCGAFETSLVENKGLGLGLVL